VACPKADMLNDAAKSVPVAKRQRFHVHTVELKGERFGILFSSHTTAWWGSLGFGQFIRRTSTLRCSRAHARAWRLHSATLLALSPQAAADRAALHL
jgi:hypothetical protein